MTGLLVAFLLAFFVAIVGGKLFDIDDWKRRYSDNDARPPALGEGGSSTTIPLIVRADRDGVS